MYTDMSLDMFKGMCTHMCMDMCTDICMNMCTDMHIDMCIGICTCTLWVCVWTILHISETNFTETCVDMCTDICIDMCDDKKWVTVQNKKALPVQPPLLHAPGPAIITFFSVLPKLFRGTLNPAMILLLSDGDNQQSTPPTV